MITGRARRGDHALAEPSAGQQTADHRQQSQSGAERCRPSDGLEELRYREQQAEQPKLTVVAKIVPQLNQRLANRLKEMSGYGTRRCHHTRRPAAGHRPTG